MATIESIATQRNDRQGRPEKLNFRNTEDIFKQTRYVMQGSKENRPVYASSRGFITTKNDPYLIAEEIMFVQELYRKTKGLRVRRESIWVDKDELNNNKIADIKNVAEGFCDYYMGRGHQAAYGIYDTGGAYEIRYVINTTSYADGSKYRHNNHDIQEQEEQCLDAIMAGVSAGDATREERFCFDELEYHM